MEPFTIRREYSGDLRLELREVRNCFIFEILDQRISGEQEKRVAISPEEAKQLAEWISASLNPQYFLCDSKCLLSATPAKRPRQSADRVCPICKGEGEYGTSTIVGYMPTTCPVCLGRKNIRIKERDC